MSVRDLIILGCSSQQPTRRRNHGAYLVRWNGEGLLFDPGEGTQRQFIFANVSPTCVTRIFISHFHGDHCLGVGSMLMRLNLDKIEHPVHCYYPASGEHYFRRLRYSTSYRECIEVVEHPIAQPGVVEEGDRFLIEAFSLSHGIENLAFRITQKEVLRFDKKKLIERNISGSLVKTLEKEGKVRVGSQDTYLPEVSFLQKGETFSIVIDTLPCQGALEASRNATLLLCESTYLERHHHLAKKYFHMTAREAAELAKKAGVEQLILTHFSARYSNLNEFEEEARAIFPNTFAADDLKVFPFLKRRAS